MIMEKMTHLHIPVILVLLLIVYRGKVFQIISEKQIFDLNKFQVLQMLLIVSFAQICLFNLESIL